MAAGPSLVTANLFRRVLAYVSIGPAVAGSLVTPTLKETDRYWLGKGRWVGRAAITARQIAAFTAARDNNRRNSDRRCHGGRVCPMVPQ